MNGAILGVDYGTHWVGLAICDPERRLAVMLDTLIGFSDRRLSRAIMAIARLRQSQEIVIGYPNDGDIGGKVIKGITKLKGALERKGFHVILWDESYTSYAAISARREIPGANLKHQKKWIDSAAATFILQSYLDRKITDMEE